MEFSKRRDLCILQNRKMVIEIKINWKEDVTPENFEKFITYILSKIGFHNVAWFGKGGGDKGRDVVAYSIEQLPFNLKYERKWIIQCKKWSRFPTKTDILNEVSSAFEHNPDFWVLAIPLNPSPSKIEYIENLGQKNRSFSFKTKILTLNEIESLIFDYPESLQILLYGSVLKDDSIEI